VNNKSNTDTLQFAANVFLVAVVILGVIIFSIDCFHFIDSYSSQIAVPIGIIFIIIALICGVLFIRIDRLERSSKGK
jgi:protein-S-isoprenylcysteine O-methyltransferase Ste14